MLRLTVSDTVEAPKKVQELPRGESGPEGNFAGIKENPVRPDFVYFL